MMIICLGHCGGTGILACGTPCPVCNPGGARDLNGPCGPDFVIIGEAFPGLFVGLNDGFDVNPFMEEPDDDE
jgi:hypothetical protein